MAKEPINPWRSLLIPTMGGIKCKANRIQDEKKNAKAADLQG